MQSAKQYTDAVNASRPARIRWWNEARFGMFIHYGLYAQIGRGEWVQAIECIPQPEYDTLADGFAPAKGCCRRWARFARQAGARYMVFTAKHHDGYCLWDTKQTDFNSVARGPGRDLVREYVDACRAEELRVGIYYSLMDWRHPDGAAAHVDPEARARFLAFTRGCVRELMTQYGPIDILWYDGPMPMQTAEGWESVALNSMVREAQPNILINNRSRLDEDFGTPEEHVTALPPGREWEACMTFNSAWGYFPVATQDALRARDVVKMLNTVTRGQGNLLLNMGPAADGSVPPDMQPLRKVGRWLAANGPAVFGNFDRAPKRATSCGEFTRQGKRFYLWIYHWVGGEITLGGFATPLKSARFIVGGQPIQHVQAGRQLVLTGLPRRCPDPATGVTVIELEFVRDPDYLPRAVATPFVWACNMA
jgi:alpha-L-fucosidase